VERIHYLLVMHEMFLCNKKNSFLQYNWNRHGVFFLVERWQRQCNDLLPMWLSFFLFFSLLSSNFVLAIQNCRFILLVIDISTPVLILLVFIFYSWLFYKTIYLFLISLFNFNLWYIYFFNLILILLIAFLGSFIQLISLFNFTFQ
jgi:hypothetical protein